MPERDRTSSPFSQPAHYGEAGTGVTFSEVTLGSVWNLQGDLEHGIFAEETRKDFGIRLPAVPNTMSQSDALSALWLGPRSWLLIARGASPCADFHPRRGALNEAGGALFDVSASRVAWRIAGAKAATVLAKSCPLDFHPLAFPPGTCAQSLLGHVNALFVRDGDGFIMMVPRSFARGAWRTLSESAAQYGYEVEPPVPYR